MYMRTLLIHSLWALSLLTWLVGAVQAQNTLLGTGVGLELRLLQLRWLSNISLSFDWGHALKDAKLGTTNQVKAGRDEFYFLATIAR